MVKLKNIVLTGSIAYDHILSYDGVLREAFLSEKLEKLSVSFLADSHDVYFGGCAANIAYSLRYLGESPIVFGVAGSDFGLYEKWLRKNEISMEQIVVDENNLTASANILSDREQNQITIFSPGVMKNFSGSMLLKDLDTASVVCAMISAEWPKRMIEMYEYFQAVGIPYIFDPGQAMTALSKHDLLALISAARGVILNEYEAALLTSRLELSFDEIVQIVGFLVRTRGELGCEIYRKSDRIEVKAVRNLQVVDPTGCGDAFRAGFLHGYIEDPENLLKACQLGNVMASFAICARGTQEHRFDLNEFNRRFEDYIAS